MNPWCCSSSKLQPAAVLVLCVGYLGCSSESWGSCSGQSTKPLRVGDQQTLNYPVVLWAPAPRAVLSTKQCSKRLFVPSTSCWAMWWDLQQAEVCKRCVCGDSKGTVLRLAQGVQSNFYQNESKSWLLQHLSLNKQANMPSLSAGTGAALGKQWVVHTGTCWATLKGTT